MNVMINTCSFRFRIESRMVFFVDKVVKKTCLSRCGSILGVE